jgi:hypothetical protein
VSSNAVTRAVELLRTRLEEIDAESEALRVERSEINAFLSPRPINENPTSTVHAVGSMSPAVIVRTTRNLMSTRQRVQTIMEDENRAWTPADIFAQIKRTGNLDPKANVVTFKAAIRNAMFQLRAKEVIVAVESDTNGACIAAKWITPGNVDTPVLAEGGVATPPEV